MPFKSPNRRALDCTCEILEGEIGVPGPIKLFVKRNNLFLLQSLDTYSSIQEGPCSPQTPSLTSVCERLQTKQWPRHCCSFFFLPPSELDLCSLSLKFIVAIDSDAATISLFPFDSFSSVICSLHPKSETAIINVLTLDWRAWKGFLEAPLAPSSLSCSWGSFISGRPPAAWSDYILEPWITSRS